MTQFPGSEKSSDQIGSGAVAEFEGVTTGTVTSIFAAYFTAFFLAFLPFFFAVQKLQSLQLIDKQVVIFFSLLGFLVKSECKYKTTKSYTDR